MYTLFKFIWVLGNWEFLLDDDGLWGFGALRHNDRIKDGKGLSSSCMFKYFVLSVNISVVKFQQLVQYKE